MKALLMPAEVAEILGVSLPTLRAWIHRSDHPLPTIAVGKTGRQRRIIAAEIEPWLAAEHARKTGMKK